MRKNNGNGASRSRSASKSRSPSRSRSRSRSRSMSVDDAEIGRSSSAPNSPLRSQSPMRERKARERSGSDVGMQDAPDSNGSKANATANVVPTNSSVDKLLLGGPMLGLKEDVRKHRGSNRSEQYHPHRLQSPLITPKIKDERFILLPQKHVVTVLALKTGQIVATLIPKYVNQDDDDDDVRESLVESVCMGSFAAQSLPENHAESSCNGNRGGSHKGSGAATPKSSKKSKQQGGKGKNSAGSEDMVVDHPASDDVVVDHTTGDMSIARTSNSGKHNSRGKSSRKYGRGGSDSVILRDYVVFVGCRDGYLYEFSLNDLVASRRTGRSTVVNTSKPTISCGHYHLSTKDNILRLIPRRVFRIGNDNTAPASLIHLACAPRMETAEKRGALVYALTRERDGTVNPNINNHMREQSKRNANGGKHSNGHAFKAKSGPTSFHEVRLLQIDIPPPDHTKSLGYNTNLAKPESIDFANDKQIQVLDHLTCEYDESEQFGSEIPFELTVIAKAKRDQPHMRGLFVVVAQSTRIRMYYAEQDTTHSSTTGEGLVGVSVLKPNIYIRAPTHRPFTAITASGNELSCGYSNGSIKVFHDLWNMVAAYSLARRARMRLNAEGRTGNFKMPKHPSLSTTTRLHWHAHAVTCMSNFQQGQSTSLGSQTSHIIDPQLFSGGEESTIVEWRIGTGSTKPASFMARIAMSPLAKLIAINDKGDVSARANSLLAVTRDNTIQLITSHNNSVSWKLQGLSTAPEALPSSSAGGKKRSASTPAAIAPKSLSRKVHISIDPRSNAGARKRYPTVLLSGLHDTPGVIHRYDPHRQAITASVEVAPYNRVSRLESYHEELPVSSIVHQAASGTDVVTVEECATENSYIGACSSGHNGYPGESRGCGIVTSIHFWTYRLPTQRQLAHAPIDRIALVCDAMMTFPHGKKNRINALALSQDGTQACTVSAGESAFRVWSKIVAPPASHNKDGGFDSSGNAVGGHQSPPKYTWTCRYRVAIPAGFSNHLTGKDAVSFSSDNSVLAIGFGNMVSIWDNNAMQLLTTVRHLDHSLRDVAKIDFINVGLMKDLILTQSTDGVSLQSPFMQQHTFSSWSYVVRGDQLGSSTIQPQSRPKGKQKDLIITASQFVNSHDAVAIAVHNPATGASSVQLINAWTGKCGIRLHRNKQTTTSEVSLGDARIEGVVAYDGSTNSNEALRVYCLTADGNFVLIQEKQMQSDAWYPVVAPRSKNGVKLTLPSTNESKKRRAATDYFETIQPHRKKSTLDVFAAAETGGTSSLLSSTLPTLSGAFVRSLVKQLLPTR